MKVFENHYEKVGIFQNAIVIAIIKFDLLDSATAFYPRLNPIKINSFSKLSD